MITQEVAEACVYLFNHDRATAYRDQSGRLCVATPMRGRREVVALLDEPSSETILPVTTIYGKRRAPRLLVYETSGTISNQEHKPRDDGRLHLASETSKGRARRKRLGAALPGIRRACWSGLVCDLCGATVPDGADQQTRDAAHRPGCLAAANVVALDNGGGEQ
jgi:hypothetical protein